MKTHPKLPLLPRIHRDSIPPLRGGLPLGIALILLRSAAPTLGATLTVTTGADGVAGSLRERIAAAAPGDTIAFDASLNGQTLVLTRGELVIGKPLTVIGPGATNLTLSGNGRTRLLRIANGTPSITVSLAGLTFTGGNGQGGGFSGRGGAIYNDHAVLIVSNCVVSASSAEEVAGGIYNFGANGGTASLTLLHSTIHGNSAINAGGGVFNGGLNGNATTTLRNCTLSDNTSGQGGALFNYGENGRAALTVLNSTFADNRSVDHAGGIQNSFGTLTISHTLLAKGDVGVNFEGNGSINNLGFNLSDDDSTTAFAPNAGSLRLGPLAMNGGTAPTHALLPGSPAMDAGTNGPIVELPFDQRGPGFDRIANGRADLGAYEVQSPRGRLVGITAGDLTLQFTGEPDEALNIEWNSTASTTGWHLLTTRSTDATGLLEYPDPGAAGQPQRFYRAVRP
ncbi:MAG: hypothetical protein JNL10_02935 [Verrucomicrobiales bacterium]|nr:hypothetical protein [Verrucomicrobiales bacterium]